MEKIRRAILITWWWGANALILALPTFLMLKASGERGAWLWFVLSATIVATAFWAAFIDLGRRVMRENGERETLGFKILTVLVTDVLNFTIFMGGFIAWTNMAGSAGPFAFESYFIISLMLTAAAWIWRRSVDRMAIQYGYREQNAF